MAVLEKMLDEEEAVERHHHEGQDGGGALGTPPLALEGGGFRHRRLLASG